MGFSAIDREENIRRIGAVAGLVGAAGIIALTGCISPYRRDRDRVQASLKPGEFIEGFLDTPIAVCEHGDPKGLYKKAWVGLLKGFTGIDDPYEQPLAPELRLSAATQTLPGLAAEVMAFLGRRGIIRTS